MNQVIQEEVGRLIALYSTAEVEILRAINRALLRENNTEYLKVMQKNVRSILSQVDKGAVTWVEQAIPKLYLLGLERADDMVNMTAGFGAIHREAAQVLASNTYMLFSEVSSFIGRRTNDIYRHLALDAIRGSTIGYKTWKQTARVYKEDLANKGITGFVDRAGKKWNMNTYAEMVARTSTMEAHLEGTKNRLLEHGFDLVKVSKHINPCDMCSPWEGKILSLSGETRGYPTVADAKDAGLFHPNCLHTFTAYVQLQ